MTTTNSTIVSNMLAKPQVSNDVQEVGGRVRSIVGTVEVDASAEAQANDILLLCPVPSNAVITSIQIANDDLDSGATNTFDVGLYTLDAAGNATAVDDDCYVTASEQFRAAAGFTELRWETLDISTLGQKAWEDAAATDDPSVDYFLAITHNATANQDGTISFIVNYVVD